MFILCIPCWLYITFPLCGDRTWLPIIAPQHSYHINGLLNQILNAQKLLLNADLNSTVTLDSAPVSYSLSGYQGFPALGLAAGFCTLVQNDRCSPAGCRPSTGYCDDHCSVFSPAVPKCFPADSCKGHGPREESKLPFSSNCCNVRKSEKAFHYSQQVSASGYINTSNQGM